MNPAECEKECEVFRKPFEKQREGGVITRVRVPGAVKMTAM
jgi:hypothetical protein